MQEQEQPGTKQNILLYAERQERKQRREIENGRDRDKLDLRISLFVLLLFVLLLLGFAVGNCWAHVHRGEQRHVSLGTFRGGLQAGGGRLS